MKFFFVIIRYQFKKNGKVELKYGDFYHKQTQ